MPASALNLRYARRRPSPPAPPDATPQEIARINELSGVARTNWFLLLGYIAFVGITLLGVQDADFFIDSRQTQLPVVNVGIPTREFFIFGPILGAALFVYLHLYLLKLWDAFAAVPATIEGEPLSLYVTPWLVNDFALRLKGGGAYRPGPLASVSLIVTLLLVFVSGPLIALSFWMLYWPAHEFGFSLMAGILFVFVSVVAMISLVTAVMSMRYRRNVLISGWVIAAVGAFLIGAYGATGITLAKAGTRDAPPWLQLSPEQIAQRFGLSWGLAGANLSEVAFVDLPDDWLPYETHKRRFRIDWCAREGLDAETCGPPPLSNTKRPPHLSTIRDRWCKQHDRYPDEGDCAAYFAALDDRFTNDWRTERKTRRDAMQGWTPDNLDLRSANLEFSILPAADLRYAQMDGADLRWAQMEGAILREARMEGAEFWGAQMEGADLREAQMQGADLFGAQMEGADLRNARMERANLREAQMEGADLSGAQMQGASFFWAKMEGADLSRAQMEGANLRGAQMQEADLQGAQMEGADLGGAQLKGANLSRAQMEAAILLGAQMEGANLQEAQMEGANLRLAQMEGADLQRAQMGGANLGSAQMEGADLRGAQMQGADLQGAQMQGADLSYSRLLGTDQSLVVLVSTNLSAVLNNGGALRFVDLRPAISGPASDFRNAFGDATVLLPIPEEDRPCHWPRRELSDREFYAHWRGWIALSPLDDWIWTTIAPDGWRIDSVWREIAPEAWRNVEPAPPPPGCVWQD